MRARMEHPRLPGQPIYVRPAAVPSYRRSGWREVPGPEPTPAADEPDQKPPRRRRAAVTTEEDSHGADAAFTD